MQRQRDDVARPTKSDVGVPGVPVGVGVDRGYTAEQSAEAGAGVSPVCRVLAAGRGHFRSTACASSSYRTAVSCVRAVYPRPAGRVKRPERTRSETELWDVVITSAVMRRGLGSGPGAGRSGETVNLNGESGLGQVGPRRAASRLTPRHTDDRKTRSGQRPSEGDEA